MIGVCLQFAYRAAWEKIIFIDGMRTVLHILRGIIYVAIHTMFTAYLCEKYIINYNIFNIQFIIINNVFIF